MTVDHHLELGGTCVDGRARARCASFLETETSSQRWSREDRGRRHGIAIDRQLNKR